MGSSTTLFGHFVDDYDCLIETGTYFGDGVAKALDAGFSSVLTCEINPELVEHARERFAGQPVTVFEGPSVEVLPLMLDEAERPAVVFLDGHGMPAAPGSSEFAKSTLVPGGEADRRLYSPVLEEVELITRDSLGDVILIDDRQCFGRWEFGEVSESEVLAMMPSGYSVSYFEHVLCGLPPGTSAPQWSLRHRLLYWIRNRPS